MFEKFGEFNSAEEINAEAEIMKMTGETQKVIELAKENGIDEDDAKDYLDDIVPVLCTPPMAALGKLKIEADKCNVSKGILKDWLNVIEQQCMEDEKFCENVRQKEKALKHCMARLIRFSFENKVPISDEIVNVTKVTHNGKEEAMRKPLYLGVPSAVEAKKIVREYYLG